MTIVEAQQKVDQWIREYGGGYFSELTNLGILTEEGGHAVVDGQLVRRDRLPHRALDIGLRRLRANCQRRRQRHLIH